MFLMLRGPIPDFSTRIHPESDDHVIRADDSGCNRAATTAARPAPAADLGVRPSNEVAPNLLGRQFEETGPNQRWEADFTYIWTGEGWLFFAAVLDLLSRRIVGWSANREMTAQLVTDALIMAIWRSGRPSSLLHHSDQGSQYSSEAFQRLLAELGITPEVAYRTDVLPRKPVYSRACVRERTFCGDMAINLSTVKALLSRNG